MAGRFTFFTTRARELEKTGGVIIVEDQYGAWSCIYCISSSKIIINNIFLSY